MAKVRLENVHKVYEGGVRAVNEFNLDIPDKEFVVFVGPSGCGKSTTLRMIAGLEDITQGKLYIDDQIVNDVESKNRDIAMVFQNYALYPHMTVYDNMAFGLKLRHTPKAEIDKRVKKAAEILEISELLSRKPKALSGGQRQRVALGRAIVREPKVFLLDEPLSNLDAKLRVQMRSEITKLHEKLKTTFIYVTHDQIEAMTMGTRIVVMKDGFIQQVDSPVSLFEEPANLFVATFLGSPQMNILSGVLSLESNKLYITLSDSKKKSKLQFSDLRRKELANDSYVGKEVLFGIRPEAITVDPKGSVEAVIDVVEQLGDETILYCAIEGFEQNLVVKAPFKGRVESKQKIKLSFDMEKAHLFDKDSTNSILGMRMVDKLPVLLNNKEIVIGKNKIALPNSLQTRILPNYLNKNLNLEILVSDISLEESKDSIKLPIKVAFTEQKTDYISAFFKVDGIDSYFALKLSNDTKKEPTAIYLPANKIKLFDEDDVCITSREKLHGNLTSGKVKQINNEWFVLIDGAKLHFNNQCGATDGELVNVAINEVGPKVIFNNKLNKENGKHNENIPQGNRIKFLAYDEYKMNNNSFIYGKVRGFDNYVTFSVDNDFSVYKMPSFEVYIPENAIVVTNK